MGICDSIDGSRRESGGLRALALSLWPRAALFSLAAALAGCSLDDGAGTILVDPGHYYAYHCNELAARWKILIARENELRGLMEKASEGSGGTVIGSLAYRSDYETVLTEERLVQRAAADKKCNFTPEYQSDRSIR
jgi:hypothetical protein